MPKYLVKYPVKGFETYEITAQNPDIARQLAGIEGNLVHEDQDVDVDGAEVTEVTNPS